MENKVHKVVSEWKLVNLKEEFKGEEIIVFKVILVPNREILAHLTRNMVMLN